MHHFFINRLKIRNQYIVPFGGLKEGLHHFDFEVTDEFFEVYSALEIKSGHLNVGIDLLRKTTLLTFDILIQGVVSVRCDRCLDYYEQYIRYDGKLFVKFSERDKNNNNTDDVIILSPGEHELDLKHYIYESISISMPYKRIHPEKNGVSLCNSEMLKYLEHQAESSDNQEENHIWDKLKELLETKNKL